MSNEKREKEMMAAADRYADEVCDESCTGAQAAETINDFCAGWRAADSHPAWVSVEDELPKENGGLFLVCDKHDRVCESAYDVEDDIWYRQSGTVLYPTNWMPLPQPPVKKGGNDESD